MILIQCKSCLGITDHKNVIMAITRNQKEAILDVLQNDVSQQKSFLILTTHNSKESLNSQMTYKLRSELMKEGIRVKVVKNTLIQKAFTDVPQLSGPSYVVFPKTTENLDEVYTPKHVVDLIKKEFENNFDIVGSVANGQYLDKARTIQLSKTPSFVESMSMIAGMLNQNATKLALVIKEVPSSVARGIEQATKTIS